MIRISKESTWLIMAFTAILFFGSCVTRKHITYFQSLDKSKIDTVNIDRKTDESLSRLRTGFSEPKIQPGDILNIAVSSINPEATAMFSFFGTTRATTNNDPNFSQQTSGFLVDAQGNIQFPIIGSINVKGKTSIEIRTLLQDALSQYLEKPVVTVRYLNFKIMLMGDVLKPGVYTFPSERVTLFEAISSAGDLTIFGERKHIQLIREVDGKNQIIRLDLTDKNVLSTKYMYLQPNDIIYVEPGKGKIASSDNVYRILPMVVTGLNIVALLIYRFR